MRRHKYTFSATTPKEVRRIAVEDRKARPMKNGKISAQCVNGRHHLCASKLCLCMAKGCNCKYNPAHNP